MSVLEMIGELEKRAASLRIAVVGDVMLDRYTWGNAERVSPEAPVLVLRADEREVRLGGAASVAALLRAFGADVTLGGVVGADAEGRTLRLLLEEASISTQCLIVDPARPTTTKERFLGRAAGRRPHQMLRVDHELRDPLGREIEDRLVRRMSDISVLHAVLISDYAKGVCSPHVLSAVIAAAQQRQIPVIVDPARLTDFACYRGADIVVPNRIEAQGASHMRIESPADAIGAGQELCRQHGFAAAVVKLDEDGIAVVEGHVGMARHIPTRRRDVCDVTGAGDMVLAIAGLCQAAGWALAETAELANAAAGLEVERLGVASVAWQEIGAACVQDKSERTLVTIDQMAMLAEAYRRSGRTIVFTNGCFDLLHVGHVTCLEEAARLGNVLVVAINSDASVRRLKGADRPIVPQQHRARVLASLDCVHHVVLMDGDTPHELLRRIQPDVLVKGGTYMEEEVVGAEVVQAYGGSVCVTGVVDGASTSALVTAIRETSCSCRGPGHNGGSCGRRRAHRA